MSLIKKKQSEEPICDIQFNVYKFTNRIKPTDKNKILVISCFSEFGCEVMGAMYCVPRLIRENPGAYVIVMGWYGRSYLYKHLVDEFWELKEEFQFLRDKAMAFHNVSKNLAKMEKYAENFGKVISSYRLGSMAVGSNCKQCDHIWGEVHENNRCPKCSSLDIVKSLFSDIPYWRQTKVSIPLPSAEKMAEADKFLTRNGEFRPVAVIARNRTTYGRNLQPEFYVKLIERLESMRYKPVWLGEKQSTLACPVPHIIDFSRMPESRDLELTLAIVAKCEFTVQFWTASTRLAAIVETPYLIFESPDQLFGQGQEAYRMALTTSSKKKLALCHFLKVYNDNDAAIDLVESCIKEMQRGNWEDVVGMVDEPDIVKVIREQNLHRLAGI
jgi:predicted Zn-ribbon and HTH transcriptional regulator